MQFDVKKPHCYYFNEICKIPHGSKNEKALSDWIVAFAQEKGLDHVQDDMGNVVIYKAATPGYEDHPGVIIQAHIDMVCEKVPESTHDFEKDPLELYVEGTHLRARGTTLGADDCMGAAYMLDILADEALPHPYLECCFTVQEENGLYGAMALKPDYFKARRLINLDGAGEYRTYTTLAGARTLTVEKALPMAPAAGGAYTLTVSGLLGGRSGDDISKERANAAKLAARVLYQFHKSGYAFRLAGFSAAGKKAGIASEAQVTFVSPAGREQLSAVVDTVAKAVAEEYEFSDPDIALSLGEAQAAEAAGAKESLEAAELLVIKFLGAGEGEGIETVLTELLTIYLVEQDTTANAGMQINKTTIAGGELLSYLNRRGANGEEKYTQPSYNMISLASGLGGAKFDKTYTWTFDEDLIANNKNRYFNEKLDQLSMDMIYGVEAGDDETFKELWFEYQKEYNRTLPEVPLFNWTYCELHNEKLQNFEMSSVWPFQYAILYATIA